MKATLLPKVFVVLLWMLLLVLLARRDLFVADFESSEQAALIQQVRHQQYYGVHLNGRRIGYVMEDFRPATEGGGFHVQQQASLRLKVLSSVQPVDMNLEAELDDRMHLKSFEFSFASPFYSTKAKGRTEGNVVRFSLDTGGAVMDDSIALPAPPMVPLNQRGYLLGKLTQKGDRLKIPFFDPFSLASRHSVVTYQGKEKQVVGGRVHRLHAFSESYSGMNISFWLDDDGRIVKEESPAGFVFEAEPKFRAMNVEDGGGEDLLASVAVQHSGRLLPEDSSLAAYRLQFPEEAEVELDGGRQRFANGRLEVVKEQLPTKGGQEEAGHSCADAEHLRPSRYVQSNDPVLVAKANEIVGKEKDRYRQVVLLMEWVHENIEKRPVIGLPDALTTLASRVGDCNEHAALFAALGRSLGIPTAIAAGVTLHKNAFYYHAWNEVCIGGQWISLDTTVNQLPADLYHIRFTRSDMEGQLAIGALLGKLKIEILPGAEQ